MPEKHGATPGDWNGEHAHHHVDAVHVLLLRRESFHKFVRSRSHSNTDSVVGRIDVSHILY